MKFKSKRGSHVGMILSFVIFIIFLFFVISVLQPAYERTNTNKENLRDFMKSVLLEEFSAEYIELLVNTTDSESDVIKLSQEEFESVVNESKKEYYWTVKDLDGEMVESTRNGGDVYFSKEESEIYRIIFSTEPIRIERLENFESFSETEIRHVKEEAYVFESKVNKTLVEYNEEYDALKKRLDIPEALNFGFKFENSTDVLLETREAPENVEVLSEQIPIQYRDTEANIKSGFVRIQIW